MIIHTLCILFIEFYNWEYFIGQDKCIKYGGTGIIYQSIKFIVLVIDIFMLHELSSFVIFYLSKAYSLTLNERKKIWFVLQFILFFNAVWLVLRCFVRNLSAFLTPDGILIFDYIHTYRYAIQSLFDLFNGFAILYCIFNVTRHA